MVLVTKFCRDEKTCDLFSSSYEATVYCRTTTAENFSVLLLFYTTDIGKSWADLQQVALVYS